MSGQFRPKDFHDRIRGEKMHTCELCGGKKYVRVEIKFYSGSVEPQEDEVLTGASSGDLGTVVEVETLVSGSWAGGDAVGFVELSSPSGLSEGDIFTEDEEINGSDGGNSIMTVTYGTEKSYGVLYPLSYLVKYKEKYYCPDHYNAKLKSDLRTEGEIDTASMEADRGVLP